MLIKVKVIAGAKEEKIEKTDEGLFRVKTRAKREAGKANERVIEMLAKHFGKPKNFIIIKKGHAGTIKIVNIPDN